MGQYIKRQAVITRLRGKVKFDEQNTGSANAMPMALLDALIDDAEGQVELDLSGRYLAPFQHKDSGTWEGLPARPTKRLIQTLCERLACMLVLATDFGMGTAVSGNPYYDDLQKNYEKLSDQMTKREEQGGGRYGAFLFPPLPGLKPNYMNTADDGFAGMPMHHSNSHSDSFPAHQMTDPSQTFWNHRDDEF